MSITEHETHERFAELGWLAAKGDETAVDGLISLVAATVKLGDLAAVTSLRLDLERLSEHPDAGEVAWIDTCDVLLAGAERALMLEAAEARQLHADLGVRQRVLAALVSSSEPVHVGWIAQRTSLAGHHVSRALRELREQKLVRQLSPRITEDKRKHWYEPTAAGRKVYAGTSLGAVADSADAETAWRAVAGFAMRASRKDAATPTPATTG
jgi:DNA-binding MarR family transcriptional regulator